MLNWTRVFLATLATAFSSAAYFAVYLLLFYVDDTFLATEELEAGSRYVEGEVKVVEEEVEADLKIQGDQRTAKVILEIANSVSEFLKFEADVPSNYELGWMPLLDVQVKVAKNNTINYKFYSKPCASKFTMMK